MTPLDIASSAVAALRGLRDFVGLTAGVPVDVLDSPNRRKQISGSVQTVDEEVPDHKRKGLTLTSRYVQRNFSIASWAIRKHLDFVASFTFQAQTGNESLDKQLEGLMGWWSRPENCDISGRHSLRSMIRLAESCRMLDGDVFFLKLSSGRLQAIEGDRIKSPHGARMSEAGRPIFNGVEITNSGRPMNYAIHQRMKGGGLTFEKWIRARNIIQHGWFDRFDQIRGVSPITSSLANYQDVYEGLEYTLAKIKVAQLFGVTFYRDASDTGLPLDEEDEDGDEETDDPRYSVTMGPRPFMLDLDPGDRAEMLESKTPATETQSFFSLVISIALKALDIPFSFFDESFTNFFGSMAARQLYLKSARHKREHCQELLRKITVWILQIFVADGRLVLPAGMSIGDLKWDWIADGVDWLRPKEELEADLLAVEHNLKTYDMITRERFGMGYRDIVDQRVEEIKYARERGAVDSPPENEPKDDPDSSEPSESGTETGMSSGADDLQSIKTLADFWGVGVRAGIVTPQREDEIAFRQRAGLPPMSTAAEQTWSDEETRRPLTLKDKLDPQATPVPAIPQPSEDPNNES